MASPKDPQTATDTAAPPPKEPPVVKSGIFTPKPPPKSAAEVFGRPVTFLSSFQELKKKGPPSDQNLLNFFKADPVPFIRELNLPQNNSERVRLKRLIDRYAPKDQQLYQAWESAKAQIPNLREKSLILSRKTQPQPAPTQEIPPATAEQLTKQEPAIIPKTRDLNELTPPERQKLETWLNGIKDHVYNSFAQSARRDVGTSQQFTRSLLSSLSLYRGGLAGFYLNEGSKELIFSALGPLGDAFRSLYEKDVQRKMSWMKNPLNPDAINYYLTSLPNQMAFKLMYYPAKATFGILARGGAPLISKVHYQEFGQTKQSYVFTPLLRATQFSNKLADGLDKLSGVPTDSFKKYWGEKSPYDQYIKNKNSAFSESLQELKDAKLSKNKDSIKKAQRNLRLLLDEHDGFYRYYKDKNGKSQEISKLPFWRRTAFGAAGVSRAVFKNGLKNFGRRARRASRDPVVGIFALIAGTLVDILAGIGINILRVAATRIINLIPGATVLRARLTEFFTSNRWLQTARIGGATVQSFTKGVFSPTTFSSGYVGNRILSSIFPHAIVNQIWIPGIGIVNLPFGINAAGLLGGTVFGAGGAFYTTALKMATNPNIINWIYKYDDLLFKATDPYSSVARQNFYRGELEKNFLRVDSRVAHFRPGPFSRFAKFLYEHPFARLPINGFMIADLGVQFLGWNPWIAYPSFIAGDYLWQVKGAIARSFATWFPTTTLGRWIGNQVLSINTWFTEKIFMRPIAWETSSLLGKMPVKWALRPFWQGLQNVWSTVQPYISNFFNPGFFMGMQFLGSAFMSMGLPWGVAHLVGGLAGAAGWWGVHAVYSAIAGKGAMSLAQWSAAGWVGYFGGLITQGLLSLLGVHGVWMQFLPMAGSLIATVGVALIPGLGSFLGSFFAGLSTYNIAWALGVSSTAYAAGMAIAATAVSIAAVAGLTVFFAYTIFAGFWMPLQQMMHAGPQSACFSLQTSANIDASGSAEICSKFTVTTDLLTDKGYIRNEIGVYNLLLADYIHLENNITKATRQIPNQALENLNYIASPEFINPGNPDVATNRYTFPVSENILQLADSRGVMLSYLITWLSTFTGNPDSNKMTIFDLIEKYPQFPGLRQMVNSSFDLLKQVQADEATGRNDTVYKFEKMRDFTKDQKDTYAAVRDKLVAAKNSTSLEAIKNNLISAKTKADAAAQTNPFSNQISELQNNCQYQTATCQELIQLYQSWPNFFNNQLTAINNLINQANGLDAASDLTDLKTNVAMTGDSANFIFNSLDQQYQSYKSLVEELDDFQNNLNDWLDILNAASPTTEQIHNILTEAFSSMFGSDKKYFFTPNGTKYEICVKGTYVGDPNKPAYFYSETDMVQPGLMGIGSQNACSAIASTTFTPQ